MAQGGNFDRPANKAVPEILPKLSRLGPHIEHSVAIVTSNTNYAVTLKLFLALTDHAKV
jgi:hypothetical protein